MSEEHVKWRIIRHVGSAKRQQRDIAAGGEHVYLSTGCLHGDHEYCKADRATVGVAKEPACCKFCTAPCICECHEASE